MIIRFLFFTFFYFLYINEFKSFGWNNIIFKKKKNNTFLHCNASKKQNLLNIIIHKYNKIVITFLKEHDKIIVVI
jgi:hypothetical protein